MVKVSKSFVIELEPQSSIAETLMKQTNKIFETDNPDRLLLLRYEPIKLDKGLNCFVFMVLLTALSTVSMSTFGNSDHLTPIVILFAIPMALLVSRQLISFLKIGRKPTSSILISTANDSFSIRYGHPNPTKEITRPLSKIDAIELVDSNNQYDPLEIFIRCGNQMIKVPTSSNEKVCHEEARTISAALLKPIFKINGDLHDIFKNQKHRLPYYTPPSELETKAIELNSDETEAILESIHADINVNDCNCPYCGSLLTPDTAVLCAKCLTPHHKECFHANGKCTMYSCCSDSFCRYKPHQLSAKN